MGGVNGIRKDVMGEADEAMGADAGLQGRMVLSIIVSVQVQVITRLAVGRGG